MTRTYHAYATDTSDKMATGDTYVPCYAMDTAYNIAPGDKYAVYVTTWILIKI